MYVVFYPSASNNMPYMCVFFLLQYLACHRISYLRRSFFSYHGVLIRFCLYISLSITTSFFFCIGHIIRDEFIYVKYNSYFSESPRSRVTNRSLVVIQRYMFSFLRHTKANRNKGVGKREPHVIEWKHGNRFRGQKARIRNRNRNTIRRRVSSEYLFAVPRTETGVASWRLA